MRACTAVLISLSLAAVPGACSSVDAPASGVALEASAAVHDALSIAWSDHIDAAIRKDVNAVLEIYADDVIYVVPGMEDVRGRDAIDAMETRTLAEADVLHAEHTIQSLSVFDDIAYELGTVIGPVRPRGGEATTVTFHFMAMWQRQADGAWRIRCFVGLPE